MESKDNLEKLLKYVNGNSKYVITLEKDEYKLKYLSNIAKLLDTLSIPIFDEKLSFYPDIKKKEYEGGFKIWECELDGVRFLLENKELLGNMNKKTILEIGCGSGLMGILIRLCMLFRLSKISSVSRLQ